MPEPYEMRWDKTVQQYRCAGLHGCGATVPIEQKYETQAEYDAILAAFQVAVRTHIRSHPELRGR